MSLLDLDFALFFVLCVVLFCFAFYRVNILKISFKRKKFFIHQRQKQVSSAHACCVCCVVEASSRPSGVAFCALGRKGCSHQVFRPCGPLHESVGLWMEKELPLESETLGLDPGSSPGTTSSPCYLLSRSSSSARFSGSCLN